MTATLSDPLALGLVAGVVLGVALVVVMLVQISADRRRVQQSVAGASRAERTARRSVDPRTQRLDDALSASPVLRRAVEVTANLASRRGALGAFERMLRAADVPVRPAEILLALACLSLLIPAVTLLLTGSVVSGLLAFAATAGVPPFALRILVTLRQKKFVSQLPDALTTLAGSLRAGRSIGQAMEALSRQTPDPMGRELRKIVAEVRLGRPLAEALDEAAGRLGSVDFDWVVLAMQIQAEVGGNLAELLDSVAATMRERSRLRGEVKALTAEGRASALMLVVMPPGLGFAMFSMNRSYMEPLIETSTGRILLGVSAVMIAGGYAWMNSMVKIDV